MNYFSYNQTPRYWRAVLLFRIRRPSSIPKRDNDQLRGSALQRLNGMAGEW